MLCSVPVRRRFAYGVQVALAQPRQLTSSYKICPPRENRRQLIAQPSDMQHTGSSERRCSVAHFSSSR